MCGIFGTLMTMDYIGAAGQRKRYAAFCKPVNYDII